MDDLDRKILGALVADASQSYVQLGEHIGLSSAAVHERVRKMKANGTVKTTTIELDAAAVGKPFLAFVEVTFSGWGKTQSLKDLESYPEVEEMHSVAGEAGLLIKVRSADAHAFECFLAKLYALTGVISTKSTIVLSTFVERPIQATVTTEWNVDLLPCN